jgi:ectoine hydroxylase-related dioxygenase (phytanoyl-CoA dioxygenase family)
MTQVQVLERKPEAALADPQQVFRAEMARAIEALDLSANIAELDMNGYTILRDAAPPEFFAELKATMLDLAEQRRRMEAPGDLRGLASFLTKNTLTRGRIFEQAILNPKLNAVMAYLLGDGYVLNTQSAMVLEQGNAPLFIHSDNAFIPDPFPAWAMVATAVWVVDPLDEALGASRVVPGSHRFGRHPRPGEGEDRAIALDCPANSIQVWNGALWHGNSGRTAPGQRVTLHTSFVRMHIRPFADHSLVPEEVIARNPPLFAQLLGRGLPFGEERDNGSEPALMDRARRFAARRI